MTVAALFPRFSAVVKRRIFLRYSVSVCSVGEKSDYFPSFLLDTEPPIMSPSMSMRGLHAVLLALTTLSTATGGVAQETPAAPQPEVTQAAEFHTSLSLRALGPLIAVKEGPSEQQPRPQLDPERATGRQGDDVLQMTPEPTVTIQVDTSFDGIGGGGLPPDPTGAVGRTQYVQAVNSSFAVFDKETGELLYGPVALSTLWNGVESLCGQHNYGDPIVVYDRIAGRWLISQFLLVSGNYSECIAVSATEDALGQYYLYRFRYPNFPDYPKFGVWPDAYYVSYNMFGGPVGGRACALEREKMLRGEADARQVCFQIREYSLLPTDFDGRALPPTGSPNYFLRRGSDGESLTLREFHVDWSNPANSRFGLGATHAPDATITVEQFNDACAQSPRTACIPQSNGQVLESLGERLMFRVAYRRFADHESLVTTHSVEPLNNAREPANNARSAIRWYEIRSPNNNPVVHQQGTFAPDTRSRWMGSIAMDSAGNIAVGYSRSARDIAPGIRIAGRGVQDPPGVLGAETVIVNGESQAGAARWGDYSQMTIDPVDDCTFWFTAEYIHNEPPRRRTRIVAFRVNECSKTRGNREGSPGGAHF
jgi:hypothetical protein